MTFPNPVVHYPVLAKTARIGYTVHVRYGPIEWQRMSVTSRCPFFTNLATSKGFCERKCLNDLNVVVCIKTLLNVLKHSSTLLNILKHY